MIMLLDKLYGSNPRQKTTAPEIALIFFLPPAIFSLELKRVTEANKKLNEKNSFLLEKTQFSSFLLLF